MATKMKKTLSLALALIMVLGMLPLTAFAAGNYKDQVGSYIGYNDAGELADTNYDTAEKATKTLEDGNLTMSKSIKQTDENAFDITLLVTTAEDLKNIPLSQDAAVVLLIDASASMYDNMEGTGNVRYSNGEWEYDTAVADQRITKAKAAAVSFVESFAKDADGTSASGKRMVAVGAFNSDAWRVQNWIDANAKTSGEANRATIKTALNQIELGSSTNPDAGLQLAYNMLGQDDVNTIASKFVILLTDGEPNAKKYIRGDDNNSVTHVGGETSVGEKNAAAAAGVTAAALKLDKKATLYTLAFATADEECYEGDACKHCNEYKVSHRYKSLCKNCLQTRGDHTKIDGKSYCNDGSGKTYDSKKFYLCQNTNPQTYYNDIVTVGDWLSSIASKDCYKNAAIDGDIVIQFDEINEQIRKLLQAWQVTDPMGKYINYKGLKGVQENNSVTFKDNTLNWNLWDSKAEEGKDTADNKTYTYTLTYSVTLDTAAQGFEENKFYATNGATKLVYVVNALNEDGTLNPTAPQSTDYFNVPSVKGEIPTLNYSIEYYLQKDGQYELQSNATKNGSAPMHTEVKLDVVDKGYQNKYDAQNYHWVKSDPATVTLTKNGTVLKVYYDHDTVKIPVNYFLATKTTDIDGNVTNEDYAESVKLENYSYEVTVNKGEKYTAEHLTTKEGYETCTYLSGDHEVMVTDGTEAINLYYKLDVDKRDTTTVDVKYQVNNYEWALETQENSEIIYKKTLVTGAVQDYQKVQNVRTPSQFTQSVDTLRTDKTLPVSEYLLTAATLVQGGATSQLDTNSDPLSFATKKGGNTLTLVFEKISEAPAETPATLTVTHNYVKDVTTIINGETERDKAAHAPFTTNPAGSATWYVGETHLINADQTKPSDGADTYLVDGESSKLVKLTAADNTASFSYELIKVPEATTATVNFIYRTYEKVTVVNDDGSKSEKTQLLGTPVTHSIQVPLTGDTLYENQYVKIPTDTEKLDGYTFNEAASTQNYTAIPAKKNSETVIDLYYDNDKTVDHRYAEVTVTHTYTATKTTVNAQGVVVTETVQEGTVPDPVYTGTAGEKMFNKDIVQLDHDGNTYVRTDTTPLDGNFVAGTNSTINLTYHRVDTSELKGATYQANYEYYDWTMTVDANGVAGYHEGAGYVKNATLSNSTAVISTTEAGDPLYAGMHVQLKGSTDNNYQVVGAPQMERILTEGNNVYTLTFVKQIPLAPATVTVNHHYERTTKNEIGVENTEKSDVAGTAAPTTLYVGAQVSVSARMDGYPTLKSITVTDADGAAVEYTPDASHNIVFTATGTDSVVFSYSDYVDHSVEATYLIQHFYRTVDWDGTTVVEGYKADDTKKQSGTTYATLHKSATRDLIMVDGKPTYRFTDITWTGCDTPVHNGETYTMELKPGENTLNFYYTKTVDNRPVVKVTVNHVYRVTDSNAPDGFVQEAVVSELKDAKTPGQYTAEKKTDRADGDKIIHYTFDSSDHEDCKLVVTTVESNNVINLYYTREYGAGEGFKVSGTKTYVGLNPDQYPVTTVSLSNGEHQYSAIVNNADGHFSFTNVAPGVYDISESASVAGYSYTAKYMLTALSYGQEVPSPQLRALVQGTVDITSNPQITVVAATEYNLEITNTYTSNPTPPPTPGTTYYGITVKYVDEAGKELSAAHTERHYEGYSYDVTDKTTLEIADYTIKSVTGDTLTGRLNGDKVITVVYAPVVVIPDEPVPEGGKPGEVILPDTEPPKNELPEELEDGAVPLDAAPKTGDTATLWTTLMAVSGFGLAALAIFKGKKKEEDSAE